MSSSDSDGFKAFAAPGDFASLTSPEDLLPKAVPSSTEVWGPKTLPSLIGAFGSSKPEDLLPKTVPSSMALFGSSKPKPKDPLPTTDFKFGQPTSPLVKGPTSGSFGQLSGTNRKPGWGSVFDMEYFCQTKSLIEYSIAPSDSESETPTVGIFGPACRASSNGGKLATFLSGDAHDSAKETFDLKLKGIKDKLPSPSKPYFPFRSATEDVLRGELADLSLLEGLMKIEELLQGFTVGYTDTDLELEVGCSWMEGIYIASIQEQMKLIGRNWKANFDPLDTEHIRAVDGVPRSEGELKILFNSVAG